MYSRGRYGTRWRALLNGRGSFATPSPDCASHAIRESDRGEHVDEIRRLHIGLTPPPAALQLAIQQTEFGQGERRRKRRGRRSRRLRPQLRQQRSQPIDARADPVALGIDRVTTSAYSMTKTKTFDGSTREDAENKNVRAARA
jgi:hypothetical protein